MAGFSVWLELGRERLQEVQDTFHVSSLGNLGRSGTERQGFCELILCVRHGARLLMPRYAEDLVQDHRKKASGRRRHETVC